MTREGTPDMNREYRIDLSGVSDRAGLHDRSEQGLPLPEWYGRNLDALYDVLTEPEFGKGCRITFSGCGDLRDSMPRYLMAMQHMCAAAAQSNPGLEVEFEME